ncbi:MarR family winged helix-turn-helix transcriptional regulator [Herbaspirillum autotrophicum]|uniref:MarR family winged helix-turn-helix transcriptional regulator n=1 Tax=Herbaspirillum autotrophicum TaxID=180195 RepID=UPI00067A75E3|nr:MarR family winged helix-turn-helix transcriptional regulator [Herbaspirillum autotrophicum]
MKKNSPTAASGLVETFVDEVMRLRGRILSAAREMNEERGLHSHSQGLILSAVVRAAEPPTVARIARSLGLTRQSVQRIANDLDAGGFIAFEDNPHHKRAKQLVPTAAGLKAHAGNAGVRGAWTSKLESVVGPDELKRTVETLRKIRSYLEHPDEVE